MASEIGLQITRIAPGKLRLQGHATFAHVPSMARSKQRGLFDLADQRTLEISLAGVEKADSAGLALLIEWLAEAQRRDIKLYYKETPAQLQAMAALCNLTDILNASEHSNAR